MCSSLEQWSVALMAVATAVGVMLNVLLLHAISTKTPRTMRAYSILIFNASIIDLLGATSTLLTIPRQITGPFGIVLIFYGPSTLVDRQLCWTCFALHVYSMTMSHCLLFMSFAYRFYVISGLGEAPKRSVMIRFIICVYLGNSWAFAGTFNELLHTDKSLLPILLGNRLDFDIDVTTIGILDATTRVSTTATFALVVFTSPVIFVGCLLMRQRITAKLRTKTDSMSRATHATHQMLLDALRAQLLIAILLSLASSIFIFSLFDIYHATWMDFAQSSLASAIFVCSPMATLFYVKPYRVYVTPCLAMKIAPKPSSATNSITMTAFTK